MAFVPAPGAYYFLVAAHSGKVLEVKDASTADGAILQQAEPRQFNESHHQQFSFNLNAERVYVLRARHSQRVVDVKAASTADAAEVHQWGWHGVDHERVHVIDAGDGCFFLQFLHSGKVLEIYGEETGVGKPAKQFHNHYSGKNLHQRFRPVLAEEGFAPAQLPGFTNPSQMMRDATLGIAGLIPEVGGAVKGVVGLLWPDAGPSMIWNQVMKYIEAYVESKLQEARITALRQAIEGARSNLVEFVDLVAGSEKSMKLVSTITALNQVDRPFFDTSAPERTVSYLVTLGTIKLTLLQEQARHYAAIAGIAKDDNKEVHERSLRNGIAEYTRAARYFREEALKARVARIGNDFREIQVPGQGYHKFTYDITQRDGGDGNENVVRYGPNGGAETTQGRAAMKEKMRKEREATVRAQFGAQLDAILAPSLLWRSFDPAQTRPGKHTLRASIGPWGTPKTQQNLSDGKEIAKIEVWADDVVHGLRVTNRQGAARMAGTEVGKRQEIALAAGEFVAGIYGSASHHLISLFLETTFGKRIAAGKLSVGPRFQADLPPELKAKLADITTSTEGNTVSSIQFHWDYELEGEYPPPTLRATPAMPPLWAPPAAKEADADPGKKPRSRKAPAPAKKSVGKKTAGKKTAAKSVPRAAAAKPKPAVKKVAAKKTAVKKVAAKRTSARKRK
jgi:hypothetical protein